MRNVKRVKDRHAIQIEYLGVDQNRLFCLRRADGQFWAGDSEWSKILDSAVIYHDHTIAQKHLRAIQNDRLKGKPRRSFTVEMTIALVGDDVADISPEVLGLFLADAVRLEIEVWPTAKVLLH